MEDRQIEDKIKFTAQKCPVCNGFGTLKYGALICHVCNGRGYVVINNETGFPVEERKTDENKNNPHKILER